MTFLKDVTVGNCLIYIPGTIYVHCPKIYNLFVWALETGGKTSCGQAFLASLSVFRHECKLIWYWTTMYRLLIFCLSCNIKKSKTPAKLSENNWSKGHSNCFQWCHLWHQHLHCYHFFLSLFMKQVPEIRSMIYIL